MRKLGRSWGMLAALASSIVSSACSDDGRAEPSIRLVVLGSSTAFGIGPTRLELGWVSLLADQMTMGCPDSEVSNLAFPGITTYGIQPDEFVPDAGRPIPLDSGNISRALDLNPTLVIINLPSNDQAEDHTDQEQIDNYDRVVELASTVPVWITTPQPRNFTQAARREALMRMRDTITQRYAPRTLDFWTDLATTDGTVVVTYDSGDGVHVNDAAHELLADRARAALPAECSP